MIVVPKNKGAQGALDTDSAESSDLLEYSLSDTEFDVLREQGLLDAINDSGQCNVDDYEDDAIVRRQLLENVVDRLQEFDGVVAQEATGLLRVLRFLFIEAIERDTGIFFYF
ncbi:hypothetical protein SOCEGT47_062060 [Sorangium cellulosum]|uniref:Uncharacterized protein n=1 Tax=Sorangium cellulosum TaxID=56 RepID=A0A4P2Q7Z2_SORCE|nr:hypothetical protein [Sorangium cellulosum]AUX25657.1 hypothetical protein SOCEGT47_062060 [Sorangium cellulosum]